MVDEELNGIVLGMHIVHLSLSSEIPHEGWCKDDGQVARGHQVLLTAVCYAGEMVDHVFQDVAVDWWELVDEGLEYSCTAGIVDELIGWSEG